MKRRKIIIVFTIMFLLSLVSIGILAKYDYDSRHTIDSNIINMNYQSELSTATELTEYEIENNRYKSISSISKGIYLVYTLNLDNYEASVSGVSCDDNAETNTKISNVSIPGYVKFNGTVYKVSKIDEFAFSKEHSKNGSIHNLFMKVTLPSTLVEIGSYAFFGLNQLSEVTFELENHLEIIGESTFQNCTSLVSFQFNPGIKRIARNAFNNSRISNVNFEKFVNLKILEQGSFAGTDIKSLKLSNSIEIIESDAFLGSGIQVVNFGKNVISIGSNAFKCDALSYAYFTGSAPLLGNNVFGENRIVVLYYDEGNKGWGFDFEYVSLSGEYLTKKPIEERYYKIQTSDFNILDLNPDVTNEHTSWTSFDYQGIKFELVRDDYTAKIVSFDGVENSEIFIPDQVIYDNQTYTISEVSIGDEASGTEALKKVVLADGIASVATGAFVKYPNLKVLCSMAETITLGDNIFAGTDYEIIAKNVTGNTYTTNVYTHAVLNVETQMDETFGIYYSIVEPKDENFKYEPYAVVGNHSDDELANTSKYSGKENGNVVIPDYISIGKEFYKVRSISRYAFYNNQMIKSISLGAFIGDDPIKEMTDDYELIVDSLNDTDKNFAGIMDSSLRNCPDLNLFSVDSRNAYYRAVDESQNAVDESQFLVEYDSSGPRKIIKAGCDVTTFDLKSYTITDVEAYAFANCYSLVDINLSASATNGIEKIGAHAFENTLIGFNKNNFELDLDKVKYLGDYAFANCYYINSVVNISDMNEDESSYFGHFPFQNCYGISKFVAKDTNEKYVSYAGVLYEKVTILESGVENYLVLLQYPASKGETSLTIGKLQQSTLESGKDGLVGLPIRRIDAYAFAHSKLITVTITDDVYVIGKAAFANSNRLTKINIGTNVDYLGLEILVRDNDETSENAKTYKQIMDKALNREIRNEEVYIYPQEVFEDCYSLANINVTEENQYYLSDNNGILYNKEKTTLLLYPQGVSRTTYTIPSSVTKIDIEAFQNNTHIQRVIVPENVEEVGAKAFNGCTSLYSIYFRTIKSPRINEHTFNSTGANKGGLIIYCIQQPSEWYKGNELLWEAFDIRKYNAIQEIPNESVTTDPLYTIFVSDADGNGIEGMDVQIKTNPDSEKVRKSITNSEGYATFTIPNLDALVNQSVWIQIIDPREEDSKVYYDYLTDDYHLDLDTTFSQITLFNKANIEGAKYQEYHIEDGEEKITRNEDISTTDIYVNKASMLDTLADVDFTTTKEYNYNSTIRIVTKIYWDENSEEQIVKLIHNGVIIAQFSFIDNTLNGGEGYKYASSVKWIKNADDVLGETINIAEVIFDINPNAFANNQEDSDLSVKFEFINNSEYKSVDDILKVHIFAYEFQGDIGTLIDEVIANEFEFNFDDDIPVLGGKVLKLAHSIIDPRMSVTYYENTAVYAFDTNPDSWIELPKVNDKAIKEFTDAFLALKNAYNKNNSIKNWKPEKVELKDDPAEPDIDVNLYFSGLIEFTTTGHNDSDVILTRNLLKGEVAFSFSIEKTWIVWVIPVNIEFTFDMSGNIIGEVNFDKEQEDYIEEPMRLDLDVEATLYGGVGCHFAAVRLYGMLGFNLFVNLETGEFEDFQFKAEFGVNIKAKLLFVNINKDFPIATYPKQTKDANGKKSYRMVYARKNSNGDVEEYDSLDEVMAATLAEIADVEGIVLEPSTGNYDTYGGYEPKIVKYNGETYKFYIDDIYANKETYGIITSVDTDRKYAYNYLKIVYSKLLEDGGWSEPKILNSDINNELDFDICSDENGIHIVYTRISEEIIPSYEVSIKDLVQVYAGSYLVDTSDETKLISNNVKLVSGNSDDYMFNLYISSVDNKVYALWLENNDDDILGAPVEELNEQLTANSIYKYDFLTGETKLVQDQLGLITDIIEVQINGEHYYAYIEDIDDKFYKKDSNGITVSSFDDRLINIIEFNGATLSPDFRLNKEILDIIKPGMENTEVTVDVFNIGSVTIFNDILLLHDGRYLYELEYISDFYNVKLIGEGISEQYIILGDDEITGIVYSAYDSSDESTDLYLSYYVNEYFTNSVKILDLSGKHNIKYFDIYQGCDLNYYIDYSYSNDQGKVFRDITLFEKNSDLVVTNAYSATGNVVSGEPFTMNVEIFNDSLESINSLTANLLNAFGEIVSSDTINLTLGDNQQILSGEKRVVEFQFIVSEVSEKYTIEVVSNVNEVTENLSNNKYELELIYPDIEVNVKLLEMGNISYLLVMLRNIGGVASQPGTIYVGNGAITPQYKVNATSNQVELVFDALYQLEYESMVPYEYKYYTIELNRIYFNEPLVTVYAEVKDQNDYDIDNNYVISSIVPDSVENGYGRYSIEYVYEKDGKTITYKICNYEHGEKLDKQDYPEFPGYIFKGWYTEPTYMPSENIKVYGFYIKETYTVTYFVDGQVVYVDGYNYGDKIEHRVLEERIGHTFGGWVDEKGNSVDTVLNENVNLYGIYNKNSYVIEYYIQGNKEPYETVTYKYDDLIVTHPAYSEPVGYTFSGWKDVNGKNIDIERMPAHNVILFGTLTVNVYNVNYRVNINGNDKSLKEVSYRYGEEIDLSPLAREGYTFNGWLIDGKLIKENAIIKMPAYNMNIYASYTIQTYKLTYVVNGENVATFEYEYNAPIPKYEYVEPDGYNKVDLWSQTIFTMPAYDVVIYAKSTPNLYNITYHINGPTSSNNIVDQFTIGSLVVLRTPSERIGYNFIGWYKDETLNEQVQESFEMPSSNIDLYPKWEPKTYKLSYYVDNVLVNETEYQFDSIVEMYEYTPSIGYSISEWNEMIDKMPAHDVSVFAYTKVLGYSIKYYVNNEIVHTMIYPYGASVEEYKHMVESGVTITPWTPAIPETMPAKDIEVYATTSKTKYTLTYYVNDEEVYSKEYIHGEKISEYNYTPALGVSFLGFKDVPETMPSHDVNVYGHTAYITYSLTYMINGEIIYTDIYTYNQDITPRIHPEKEGYIFTGWKDLPRKMPANKLIVTGEYEILVYDVNYYCNNELIHTDKYKHGEEIIPYQKIVREGYTFSGWTNIPEYATGNVDVMGTLSINSYKVKYFVNDELYKVETYHYGETIKLEKPLYISENKFNGWKLNQEEVVELTVYGDVELHTSVAKDYTLVIVASSVGGTTIAGVAAFFIVKFMMKKKRKSKVQFS